jgi:hypothetical protein
VAGALLFANDLADVPDVQEKVFQFTPRDGVFAFKPPACLTRPAEVFRPDADGPHDVKFLAGEGQVTIHHQVAVAGICVVAPVPGLRPRLQARHVELLPDLRTTGVWRSLERRIQIPRRCSLFPSFPSVLPTEGNEENEKEGNWVCAS